MKWSIKKCSVPPHELTAFYGTGKPLAYALYNRKIRNRTDIEKYTNPQNFRFEDITNLKGVSEAFSVIKYAVDNNKKIYIYGDYDVDGVMSTSIMYKGLKNIGANVFYFIPDRVEDGYGLNEKAVKRLIDNGAELIITCDNGISAVEQISFAINEGVSVVVLDHHEPAFEIINGEKQDILPNASAVVDAKIQDCGFSFSMMCAGGLCYRFIDGFYSHIGRELKIKKELLELAAVATICDVVDLTDDNRAIASMGISLINSGSRNLGLKTLIELKEIKEINSYTLGFVIGPCINACGRLDSAKIAVELFVTDSRERALGLAQTLVNFNEERKTITYDCLGRIIDKVETSSIIDDKIIVVYDAGTHESVAGIIAGRLRERYDRPAIVLTDGSEGVKGSCRSVESFDIFKALNGVKELLTKFGGHTMAAGLSLDKSNIDLFRKKINDNCKLSLDELESTIRAEAIIGIEDITVKNADELNIISPFGKANEKPLFGLKNVKAADIRLVGKENKIVSFTLTDGKRKVRAVDFNNYEVWRGKLAGINIFLADFNIDCICSIDVNEYKEYRTPQVIIRDIRFL